MAAPRKIKNRYKVKLNLVPANKKKFNIKLKLLRQIGGNRVKKRKQKRKNSKCK